METQLNSDSISKQLIHMHGKGELMTVVQIKQSFDSILRQINENNDLLLDTQLMKELIDLVIYSNEQILCDSIVINHQVFFVIRDFYSNLLRRWRCGDKFDDISYLIFEVISNSFLKMSSFISDIGKFKLKELIFHDPLINEINKFLEGLSNDGKYLKDPQIKSIDNLFRIIQRLERIYFDNKKGHLFDNIVKCICSSLFIEIFVQSINQEHDDAGQKFLLNTCTDYVCSHSTDKQYEQSLINIRQSILRPFTQWLIEQSSFFRSWNNRTTIVLRQICFLLTLSIQFNGSSILHQDVFNFYCQLIDSFINILYSISQIDNKVHNKLKYLLIGTIIPNLYTMTLSNQLEKYIQSKHIVSLILKLTDFENEEIQLNAFKILSSITTEQETKNINYSNNIATLFIKFLNKFIDDSNQTSRFYNLLRCLQSKSRPFYLYLLSFKNFNKI